MKPNPWLAAALLAAGVWFTGAEALAVPPPDRGPPADRGGGRPDFPTAPPRGNSPPRPPGLGGELPPGHGGPNPRDSRGAGGEGRFEIPGLARVCGPGGALSGEVVNGQIGRGRARALVCGDD